MKETNTIAILIVGFFLGVIFTLALMCAYQFLNAEYGASPLQEIRSAFNL